MKTWVVYVQSVTGQLVVNTHDEDEVVPVVDIRDHRRARTQQCHHLLPGQVVGTVHGGVGPLNP